MEFNIGYFLVFKKANCSGAKMFKIPISVYNSNGNSLLSTDEKCAYSSVYQRCKLVDFLDFEKKITLGALEFIKDTHKQWKMSLRNHMWSLQD